MVFAFPLDPYFKGLWLPVAAFMLPEQAHAYVLQVLAPAEAVHRIIGKPLTTAYFVGTWGGPAITYDLHASGGPNHG